MRCEKTLAELFILDFYKIAYACRFGSIAYIAKKVAEIVRNTSKLFKKINRFKDPLDKMRRFGQKVP